MDTNVNWMPHKRLPRLIKNYTPKDKRNRGRTMKRLLDAWDRNGSTSDPTPLIPTSRWWWWWLFHDFIKYWAYVGSTEMCDIACERWSLIDAFKLSQLIVNTFQGEGRDFCHLYAQNNVVAHPGSYSDATVISLHERKRAGAWNRLVTFMYSWDSKLIVHAYRMRASVV
jgi:hypothetical protein